MILNKLLPIKKLKEQAKTKERCKNNPLIEKYLYGLSGIEIGGSGKSFGLDGQKGSYANIDIVDAATRAKFKGWKKSQLVNIIASGDKLPFKNEVFDYVFSSHVLEHFFDPIKAIEEWFRVIKKGGYVYMIIPHKERTFDRSRELTSYQELTDRNNNTLGLHDYAQRTKEDKLKHENKNDKDHHLIVKDQPIPNGWEKFTSYDFGHHWSVWDTNTFLELCTKKEWNVINHMDLKGEKVNEFTVILKKN